MGRREEKSHREPLSLNENDFNGYLNSTFQPDLNIKNKKSPVSNALEQN